MFHVEQYQWALAELRMACSRYQRVASEPPTINETTKESHLRQIRKDAAEWAAIASALEP
jgi:hypothetical protein